MVMVPAGADGWLFVASERSTIDFAGWFSIRSSSSTERELGCDG